MIHYKSEYGINLMRESCQIVYDTLKVIESNIRIGVTGEFLDKLADDYILYRGAVPSFKGYKGFPSSICISINDEVVHGIPSDRELEDGDIVSIDCGAYKNGFHGDSAYTYEVGEVGEETKNLLRVTEEALYKGIEQATVGNKLGDISYTIQLYVEDNGYSIVREYQGHGIGNDLHEDPQVPNFGEKNSGLILTEGLVIAIEPMVNMGSHEVYVEDDGWTVCTKDNKPSAHFEHTVVIREGKAEILSGEGIDTK